MDYLIEQITNRGAVAHRKPTKRTAHFLAEQLRNDNQTISTVVTRPNGVVRICYNPKRSQK